MNILYTSTTYPPCRGGAQSLLHKTVQMFAQKHQVRVVTHWDENRSDWLLGTTLRAPARDWQYAIDGIEVARLGFSLGEKVRLAPFVAAYYPLMPLALPGIAAVIGKHLHRYAEGIDLVHNIRIGREGLSLASLNLARKRNIPFVLTTVHHPRWNTWRHQQYIRIYKQADVVIALSEGERSHLLELGVKEDRITITGSGPFLEERAFPEEFCARHLINGPFVLFLAQHFEYKGYRQVLESMRMVWKRFPDLHFVFMGTPVGDSEKSFIPFAPDPRVHRITDVSAQEKTDAMAACAVFCMPSTQESFGIVYVEAWCFEKPVIGCSIPSVSSVIDNEQNGLLVRQEAGDIADKICWVLGNPARARQMGISGAAKASGVYSWENVAGKTEEAYRKAGCK